MLPSIDFSFLLKNRLLLSIASPILQKLWESGKFCLCMFYKISSSSCNNYSGLSYSIYLIPSCMMLASDTIYYYFWGIFYFFWFLGFSSIFPISLLSVTWRLPYLLVTEGGPYYFISCSKNSLSSSANPVFFITLCDFSQFFNISFS